MTHSHQWHQFNSIIRNEHDSLNDCVVILIICNMFFIIYRNISSIDNICNTSPLISMRFGCFEFVFVSTGIAVCFSNSCIDETLVVSSLNWLNSHSTIVCSFFFFRCSYARNFDQVMTNVLRDNVLVFNGKTATILNTIFDCWYALVESDSVHCK